MNLSKRRIKTSVKNFIYGMGSVLSIYPPQNISEPSFKKPRPSDAEALRSDWVRVGDDMRTAMTRVEHERRKLPRK